MIAYLIVRHGTIEILGASWSTDLSAMERLAPKLGGIPVPASFLMKRGVHIVIGKPPFPRTMLVGEGAHMVALVEEKKAPYGGREKSELTVMGHLTRSGKRQQSEEAA